MADVDAIPGWEAVFSWPSAGLGLTPTVGFQVDELVRRAKQ